MLHKRLLDQEGKGQSGVVSDYLSEINFREFMLGSLKVYSIRGDVTLILLIKHGL